MPDIDETELRLFVGEKAQYYLSKWGAMGKTGSRLSWNWAPFFVGIFWFAYRKMYFYMWIIFGILFASILIEDALIEPERFSRGTALLWNIVFGFFGNHCYHRHVRRKIASVKSSVRDKQLMKMEIAKRGGTDGRSVLGAVMVFALFFFIFFILLAETNQ